MGSRGERKADDRPLPFLRVGLAVGFPSAAGRPSTRASRGTVPGGLTGGETSPPAHARLTRTRDAYRGPKVGRPICGLTAVLCQVQDATQRDAGGISRKGPLCALCEFRVVCRVQRRPLMRTALSMIGQARVRAVFLRLARPDMPHMVSV